MCILFDKTYATNRISDMCPYWFVIDWKQIFYRMRNVECIHSVYSWLCVSKLQVISLELILIQWTNEVRLIVNVTAKANKEIKGKMGRMGVEKMAMNLKMDSIDYWNFHFPFRFHLECSNVCSISTSNWKGNLPFRKSETCSFNLLA